MQSSALIHEIGDARQREILHLRYEAGLSMVAIALRLHYDLRTVQRHHRRALSLLALRLMHGRTQIEGIDWNRYQAGFFLQLHEKRQHTQEMLSP